MEDAFCMMTPFYCEDTIRVEALYFNNRQGNGL
jgi:hypothetical protein